jgi:hypothetical protein
MQAPGHGKALSIEEIGNTYVGEQDRFVVSLVVGYGAPDETPEVTTPEQAAYLALDLTTDLGSHGTHWYVHDRQTGITHTLEQSDFENGGHRWGAPECAECGYVRD